MKKFTKLKTMLKYNLKTLLGFEAIYKLSTTLIFIPLFLSIFKIITKVSGYTYLTFENFLNFLLNPLTIIFLIILLILMTFYALIDISTLIIILDCSYNETKISIKEAFILGFKKSLKVFSKKNLLFPFLILFLMPFLNLGISSSLITTIKIPEFISDYISHNLVLSSLYLIVVILFMFLMFRWIYALHYFVLEDKNFKEARQSSASLSKKNKIKDFLSIIFGEFIVFLIYFLFIIINIFLIIGITKIFSKINLIGNISITIIWLLIAFSFLVITLLSTPIVYSLISILYYQHREKKQEKINHLKINNSLIKAYTKKYNVLKYTVLILTLIGGTTLTYFALSGKYNLNVEHLRTMEVTAHRGASKNYPENTMSAFIGAKKEGADWIELDVQQTKDQKLIVLHDTNLKRTTGVNKNTWDMIYDEIKELDAGSFFSAKFKGEKIPLLSEVLEFAKENNIKLNIELKPTNHEIDFEQSVVSLIKEYNFQDNCVITSQVYSVLENVKKASKDVQTVYVMSLAYGDILKLKDADNFSIEASSVTKTLVSKVHNAGKELYAWTVNTKESITNMIELNVDNIITDDIPLASYTIYQSKTSNLIQEYIKLINKYLK